MYTYIWRERTYTLSTCARLFIVYRVRAAKLLLSKINFLAASRHPTTGKSDDSASIKGKFV